MDKSNDNFLLNIGFMFGSGPMSLSLTGRTETQFLPGYVIKENDTSGVRTSVMTSSFFSPASVYLSYGYNYSLKNSFKGKLEMGVCGGRADFFINQHIYKISGREIIYGVEYGEYFSTSHGISIRYEVGCNLSKYVKWSNTGNFNVRKPYASYNNFWNQADFEMRNSILLLSGKRVKTKIENVMKYNPLIDNSLQLKHSISVGFGN